MCMGGCGGKSVSRPIKAGTKTMGNTQTVSNGTRKVYSGNTYGAPKVRLSYGRKRS